MFDIDPQHPALRLGETKATKLFDVEVRAPEFANSQRFSAEELLAIAERQMEEAIKRWVDAHSDWVRERQQAQHISAISKPVGDGMMRYANPVTVPVLPRSASPNPQSAVFRGNGAVERF